MVVPWLSGGLRKQIELVLRASAGSRYADAEWVVDTLFEHASQKGPVNIQPLPVVPIQGESKYEYIERVAFHLEQRIAHLP